MVILCGWVFLMSEVPLYRRHSREQNAFWFSGGSEPASLRPAVPVERLSQRVYEACTPICNTFYYREKSRATTEFVHGCLGRFEEKVTP